MRCRRSIMVAAVFVCLLLPASLAAQQTTSTGTQPAVRDPQAVTIIQAAITALGGAAAIGQAQTWTFQASMQGSRANGEVEYSISTDTDTGSIVHADGTTEPAPLIHSFFVPALVGAVLLNQLNDTNYSITYREPDSLNSQRVTVVAFSAGSMQAIGQVWYFDSSTSLPVRIDFRIPAQIGSRVSTRGMIQVSDFRPVGGVLFPFQIVFPSHIEPAEIVTLKSVVPNPTPIRCPFNGQAGDLR